MISIIIPMYNAENYIEETITYIQASDYDNFEIIIVDDGSVDSSSSIVNKLLLTDNRIKYFYKENGGIVSARNFGLKMVSGDYICFVDQDDIVKFDMMSIMLHDIEKYDADFVRAGASRLINGVEIEYVDQQQCNLINNGDKEYEFYMQTLIMRGSSLHPEYKFSVTLWACLFRRDFIEKNQLKLFRFLDYEDDWLFTISAFDSAQKICIEKKTVYSWRIHNKSESSNRIISDLYIENFYQKYIQLSDFLIDKLNKINIKPSGLSKFKGEMQKQSLLWGLSNETGKGINNRSFSDSLKTIKLITHNERIKGFSKYIMKIIPGTISSVSGLKKIYYIMREQLLIMLLISKMEHIAIFLNKKILHGRYHI